MKSEQEIKDKIKDIRNALEYGTISFEEYNDHWQRIVIGLEWVLYSTPTNSNVQSEQEELPKLIPKQKRHYTKQKQSNMAKRKGNGRTPIYHDEKHRKNREYMKKYNAKKKAEAKKHLGNLIRTGVKESKPTKEQPATNPIL